MRSRLRRFLWGVALLPLVPWSSASALNAPCAMVYDPVRESVVLADDADTPRAPASTTKLMTALLAAERLDPDRRLKVSARAAGMPRTKADLRVAASYRAGDLLTALLVGSSNDAAVVLAEGVSGSEAKFAETMTARARALGCRKTRFLNASGLTQAGQVSTCRDLLRIYAAVRQSPVLMGILRRPAMALAHPGGGSTVMQNHNKLLGDYPGAPVGKTGYTRAARHCFVGSFVRGGREYFIACMGSTSLWEDLRALTLGGADPARAAPPPPEAPPAFSKARVRAVQKALAKLGERPGKVDGVLGPHTREALRKFQKARGLLADALPRDATCHALERLTGIAIP
jgi:D-alanyl-D-alanine carboxypeptidase (penicillin-binding protein 5/6)